MAVPRNRHSNSRKKLKRTHRKDRVIVSLSTCKECGASKLPHRVCSVCGSYKGRKV